MKAVGLLALGAVLGGVACWFVMELAPSEPDARRVEARLPEAIRPPPEVPARREVASLRPAGTPGPTETTRAIAEPATEEPSSDGALWAEILARLEAIEARLAGLDRRSVETRSDGRGPDLGVLIQEALAAHEDRNRELEEQERAAHELEDRAREAAERRFEVNMWVAELANEVPMLPEEREVLGEALMRMQEREEEKYESFDPLTADPETWQQEFEAIREEFWSDLRRDLGDQLVEALGEHL